MNYQNRVGTVLEGKYEILKQIGKGRLFGASRNCR